MRVAERASVLLDPDNPLRFDEGGEEDGGEEEAAARAEERAAAAAEAAVAQADAAAASHAGSRRGACGRVSAPELTIQ